MMEFKNVEEKIIFEKLTELPLCERLNETDSNRDLHAAEEGDRIERFLNQVAGRVHALNACQDNPYYRDLASNRKVIGKPIVFIKRVIRRLLSWLIDPICAQQTAFNSQVTPSIGRLVEASMDMYMTLNQMREKIAALEAAASQVSMVNELELKCAELQEKLSVLEQTKAAENNEFEQKYAALRESSKALEEKCAVLQDKISALELAQDTNFWNKRSVSQSGEDMILAYIAYVLGVPPEKCSYLDLGANHAKDMSNTYYFYGKGARGVLVEANPQLIGELKFYRGQDVVLNKCVAPASGQTVDFYILSGDGLSTPDYGSAMEAIQKNPALSIVDTVAVQTISVHDILEQYFQETPVILNIDIEGKELEILGSIDFEKHRPLIVILETIPYRPHIVIDEKRADIGLFMTEHHYVEYAFTGINSIFIDKKRMGVS